MGQVTLSNSGDCVARIHHDRYQGIMLRMRITSRPKSENISVYVRTRNESQFCATNNLLKLLAICPGGQSDPCNTVAHVRRAICVLPAGAAFTPGRESRSLPGASA